MCGITGGGRQVSGEIPNIPQISNSVAACSASRQNGHARRAGCLGCECETFSILDLPSLRHPSLHNCILKDMTLEDL